MPAIRTWNGMSCQRGADVPEPPFAMLRAISNCGQPCRACQTRYGVHNTAITIAPAYNQGDRKICRGPHTATPRTRPATKNATRSESRRPSPPSPPTASQSRLSCVRTARSDNAMIPAHTGRSNVVVLSRWPVPRAKFDNASPAAATDWARRSAPSSRAMRPRQHDARGNRKRRGQSEDDERGRGDRRHDSRHERHERRLVRIAPREVAATLQEVQLVAVVAVPAGQRDQQRRDASGDRGDRCRREPCRRWARPRLLRSLSGSHVRSLRVVRPESGRRPMWICGSAASRTIPVSRSLMPWRYDGQDLTEGATVAEAQDMASRLDTSVPHPARRYNYWLGGKDNFAADRESGDAVVALFPSIRTAVVENRYFLRRAVSLLAGELGIRQFLDIGTGLPTADNTHEVAQRVAPESSVVYVDNDPLVMVHARALLTAAPGAGPTTYIEADVRSPEHILREAAKHPGLQPPDRADADRGPALHRRRGGPARHRQPAGRRPAAGQLPGAVALDRRLPDAGGGAGLPHRRDPGLPAHARRGRPGSSTASTCSTRAWCRSPTGAPSTSGAPSGRVGDGDGLRSRPHPVSLKTRPPRPVRRASSRLPSTPRRPAPRWPARRRAAPRRPRPPPAR